MFYNTEILTSRKGGFAVFWLAATVGSRGGTAVRKLSKKDLLGCNVVKACEKVREPEEPLALRLSSQLMFGITRVFSQQYNIYANDVQQVHAALKRVVSEAVAAAPDTTLAFPSEAKLDALPQQAAAQVAKEAAGPGGINFSVDAGLAYIGYDPDADLGLEWHLPGNAPPDPLEGLDEPDLVTPDISGHGSPAEAKVRKPHQAREEDIRLHEPQLDDYLYKRKDASEVDDILGEEDFGMIFGENEQGLLEGVSPELDAVIRAGSAASRAGSAQGSQHGPAGLPASSSAGGPAEDLGGFDQQFFDYDFGGDGYGGDKQQEDGQVDVDEQVRLGMEAARARLSDAGPKRSVTPLEGSHASENLFGTEEDAESSGTRKRVSDALTEAQNKAAEAKKTAQKSKKPKRLPIDRQIDLEEAKVKDMRHTYDERMQLEREKATQAQMEREAQQKARELIFGAPALFSAPGLSKFWANEIAARLPPVEGGKEAARKRAQPAAAAHREDKKHDGSVHRSAEPEAGRPAASGRLSEQPEGGSNARPWDDLGNDFFNQDFGGEGYGMQGDLGGHQDFHFDEYAEVEQGRAASAAGRSASQRPSLLPWAAELASSDVGGSAAHGDFGRAQSPAGGSKVSLEAGVEPNRRSRSPSLLPSPGRGGSVGGLLEDEAEGIRLSQSPRASGLGAEEPALAENESLKFLSYARRQASAIDPGKPLIFSDIVPISTTAPSVAAQALYHLLGLATKGLLQVDQREAYGKITVKLM